MGTDEKTLNGEQSGQIQDTDTVSCSVFGETFKLRCSKKDRLKLSMAVSAVEDRCANMLKENSFLRPVQAAILVAINAQSELIEYTHSRKSLPSEARVLIDEISKELQEEIK